MIDFGKMEIRSQGGCRICGNEPSGENVATEAGKVEFCRTSICEKCFDNTTFDMSKLYDIVPEWLAEILGNDTWLAGGFTIKAVNPSHKASDIDIFFKNKDAFDRACNYLSNKFGQRSTESGVIHNFVCDRYYVQLIGLQYYESMEDLISDFDIHACACAFDGNRIVKHSGFVFDNLNKFINLNEIKRPKRVLSRICKYVSKGYSLTPSATRFYTESLINMSEIPKEPDAYLPTGGWKDAAHS